MHLASVIELGFVILFVISYTSMTMARGLACVWDEM